MKYPDHFNRPAQGIWHIVKSPYPPPEFDGETIPPIYENYLLDGEHQFVGELPVIATAKSLAELIEKMLEIGAVDASKHRRNAKASRNDIPTDES
ncbi:hypothetical protein [Pandoraea sputorum]|uniref:hypothetical protein n=1 Tax=Pandoraea sputorum TaxID=93222 RepID=UPI002F40E380